MQLFLSLENCKKLKDAGCDVESEYYYELRYKMTGEEEWIDVYGLDESTRSVRRYNISEIITNGEMAEAFFGDYNGENQYHYCGQGGLDDNWCMNCDSHIDWESMVSPVDYHTTKIKNFLLDNKKESAEAYLLEHTVFNQSK